MESFRSRVVAESLRDRSAACIHRTLAIPRRRMQLWHSQKDPRMVTSQRTLSTLCKAKWKGAGGGNSGAGSSDARLARSGK